MYTYRDHTVSASSGLNAWNGLPKTTGSTKVRPEGEAYIPIPKALWKKKPHWVSSQYDMSDYGKYHQLTGKSSYSIHLHMPDGATFDALFAQEGFKSLQTNPQSVLGKWILNALGIKKPQRERYDLSSKNIVTMDLLNKIGYDSLKLWREDSSKPDEIWIDFAEFGSFERFMNDELQAIDEE